MLNIDKNRIRELPHEIIKLYDNHFSRNTELSKKSLIIRAEQQLIHASIEL